MGKHDKETRFSWDVPEGAFAEAENRKLKAENEKLRARVTELEAKVIKNDRAFDFIKETTEANKKRQDEEVKELIADHMDEIHELEYQIEKLKEALVTACLREV